MPIELTWLIPNKILLSRWIGAVGATDGHALVDELLTILDAASRPVHTIIDLSENTALDPEVALVYSQSAVPAHPRRGRIGVVGAGTQRHVLADLLNRFSGREMFRLFETHDEALAFLLRHDSPPPPLSSGPTGQTDAGSGLKPPPANGPSHSDMQMR